MAQKNKTRDLCLDMAALQRNDLTTSYVYKYDCQNKNTASLFGPTVFLEYLLNLRRRIPENEKR